MTTDTRTYRSPAVDDELRAAVCEWLRSNGIDPSRVPAEPQMRLADGLRSTFPKLDHDADAELTTLVKDQKDGHDIVNPSGTGLLKHFETFPIHVLPTGAVKEWLAARCPTCGA